MTRSRLAAIVLITLAAIRLGVAAISAAHIWRYSPDDAFITFRYAENFARGWGLTFNHEPPRAEGYTSVLWTLLMALAPLGHVPMVVWSKVLGTACAVATLAAISAAVYGATSDRTPTVRAAGAAAASVLFLSFPYVTVHTISGMETALATALYAVAALALCRIGPYSTRQTGWFLGPVCLLLGLTRPDAHLFCVCVLTIALFRLPAGERRGFAMRCVAAYLVPAAVYFVWRFQYYGLLFPLPFYLKATRGGLPGLLRTLAFVKVLLPMFAVPLGLGLAAKPRVALTLLVPAGLVLAYFTTVDQIMGFGYRFLYPVLPVLSVVAGLGVTAMFPGRGELLSISGSRRVLAIGLVCVSLAFGVAHPLAPEEEALSDVSRSARSHGALGLTLGSLEWRSPNPVLAISDAGVVPYYARIKTIDLYGLNDPYIARHAQEDRSAYLLAQNPTVVVLVSTSRDRFSSAVTLDYEDAVYASVTKAGYTSRAMFVFDESYVLWVLWRPDSPDAAVLDAAMKGHGA